MEKYKLFTAFFMVTLMAASCKKDDAVQKLETIKITQTTISGVNGPVAGSVGQQLTFNLLWQSADSLAKFSYLQDSAVNNTRHIKLFAITSVTTPLTSAIRDFNTVPYPFKAPAPGVYYLKFYKQNSTSQTAIIDTLVIK